MPKYRADPDIRAVLESHFEIPGDLDPAEVERLQQFLRCDQVVGYGCRRSQAEARPSEADLSAAASAAMTAYDERSERLPLGWQKLLVLQAGIAGSEPYLDSSVIQDWAYTRIEENPDWLGDFDEEIDHAMPLRWLTETIGVDVFMARQAMAEPVEPPAPGKKKWFGKRRGPEPF